MIPQTDSTRNTIHILTGSLSLSPLGSPANLNIDHPVYIDGTNTVISGPQVGPAITIRTSLVTLSHVTLSTASVNTVSVVTGGGLRLFDTKVNREVDVTGGSLQAAHATFNGGVGVNYGITCSDGATSVESSTFTSARITATNCQVVLKSSRFDEPSDGGFDITGGSALVENNLIVAANGISDSSRVFSVLPGSVVRFNTFVCTDQVASDGSALGCDSTVDVTSNIFAWGSQHPHGSGCSTR